MKDGRLAIINFFVTNAFDLLIMKFSVVNDLKTLSGSNCF